MNRYHDIQKQLHVLEERMCYQFTKPVRLMQALTHSSFANEHRSEGLPSNERLEFLGDAVLGLSTADHLFSHYPDRSEGELTRIRASVVCESTLARCAREIGLGGFLLLGKGEEMNGGRERISILSDCMEAVLGSVYLDGGLDVARKLALRLIGPLLDSAMKGELATDWKTQLQELVQARGETRIAYEIIEERGPDHSKVFRAQVRIGEVPMGTGEGRSKKEAEQQAASIALLLQKKNV